MAVSYTKLWKILIDKRTIRADLRCAVPILKNADNTMLNFVVDNFNKNKDGRLTQRMIVENQAL